MRDQEIRIIELMENEGLSEDEATAEILHEDSVDQAVKIASGEKDEPEIFVSENGDVFEELFTPAPAFNFLQVSDEVHSPGDTLDKYSDIFQQNVKLLRAEEDPDKLSIKGKKAYANRHVMTAKEWNFWNVEYRVKKNELMVVTDNGKEAELKLRAKLSGMSEEGVRQFGRELHDLTRKDANGKSALQRIGDKSLNAVEIGNLWTIWREFSGQRPENEGIDFIIE